MDQLNRQAIDNLKENFIKLEKSVFDGFAKVYEKLELMEEHYVRRTELDRALERRDERISELENNQKWVVRSIIGIVIIAIMSIVLVKVSGTSLHL